MVVLDAMEKCAGVRVLQTELNDSPGVCLKLYGPLGDDRVRRASGRGNGAAPCRPRSLVARDPGALASSRARLMRRRRRINPLIEQSTVQRPEESYERSSELSP